MKLILQTIFLSVIFTVAVAAQTKVTFNVNLQPMLEDSSFVPGQDFLEVTGNLHPFTRTTRFELKDSAPRDSVYSVTLDFPRRLNGQTLTFNYVIKSLVNKERTEFMERTLILTGEAIELPPLYFDSFSI